MILTPQVPVILTLQPWLPALDIRVELRLGSKGLSGALQPANQSLVVKSEPQGLGQEVALKLLVVSALVLDGTEP